MYDLKDKSIIVTGAGSGIGREAALLAAQAGARVTVSDLDQDNGRETVSLLVNQGGAGHFVQVDASNAYQVQAMVESAITTYRKLDGAFNNAGIPQRSKPFHDLTAT